MWLSLKSCASSSLKIHTVGLDMRKNKIPMTWHCFESSKCESIHLWYFSITMQRETLVVGLPWPNMHGQTYFWSSISTWSKKYFCKHCKRRHVKHAKHTKHTKNKLPKNLIESLLSFIRPAFNEKILPGCKASNNMATDRSHGWLTLKFSSIFTVVFSLEGYPTIYDKMPF